MHCSLLQLKQGLSLRCRATATGERRKKLMGALELLVFQDNLICGDSHSIGKQSC